MILKQIKEAQGTGASGSAESNALCFRCGQRGHIAAACPEEILTILHQDDGEDSFAEMMREELDGLLASGEITEANYEYLLPPVTEDD